MRFEVGDKVCSIALVDVVAQPQIVTEVHNKPAYQLIKTDKETDWVGASLFKLYKEPPYLVRTVTTEIYSYNPAYGNPLCQCGHTYYSHFDSFDNMKPVGCKYCGCERFIEC